MRTAEHVETIMILKEILQTLKDMKKQEFDYWEAWKIAKNKEQKPDDTSSKGEVKK